MLTNASKLAMTESRTASEAMCVGASMTPSSGRAHPLSSDVQFHPPVVVIHRTQQLRAVLDKGHLPDLDAQPLHLRIGLQQATAEECGEPLVGRTRVLERHGVDKVLHGVGRHHVAVIAMRVGREEIVPEDVDAYPAGEQPTDRVRPVEGDVVLAIADVGFHERNRSSAMSTMARRPSSSSCSRDRRSRCRSTSTISALGRRLTNTTKRKPKRRSYSAFSRSSSGRASLPCSCSERVERRPGFSPIRGWALSVATFSDSVKVVSIARIRAITSSVES